MLVINTKSTNLSPPSLSFLFISPLPYHLKSCYSLSFLNSRLLLVVLSVSSRLIVSKADISSTRASDRFGLTFYDTCADSTSQAQVHTTASECTWGPGIQRSFLIFTQRFPRDLSTGYLVSNLVNLLWSQNMSESVQIQEVGKSLHFSQQLKWKKNLSITKKDMLPFFISKM